jgi:NADPH-dependent curcumin reductase CurA
LLELQSVVSELRDELTKAMAAAESATVAFQLAQVELELTVVAEKQAGGSAKVKFWVAELGADAKISGSQTQKVKLTLLPQDVSTGSQPWVRGESADGER